MGSERSDAELASALEALALEVVERLTQRAEAVADDVVAADELFLLAGHVEATLFAAAGRAREVRERLDRSVREGG